MTLRMLGAGIVMIAASAATQNASATSPPPGSLLRLPSANEAAATTAAVRSETPFQRFVVLTCTGEAGGSVFRAGFCLYRPCSDW